MDCLKNYIGLKTGQTDQPPPPASGIYINALPGITADMFNKIAEKEDATHLVVWSNVQEIAGIRMHADIVSKLSQKFELKSISGHFTTGIPTITNPLPTLEAPGAGERGVVMRFRRRAPSFEAVSISAVHYHSPGVRTGTIVIRNGHGAIVHETAAIDFVAGINTIQIDKTFADDTLFIGTEAPGGSYATTMDRQTRSCFCETVTSCHQAARPVITGATYDGNNIIDDGDVIHGIGLSVDMICDYASSVCHNKKLFLSSWMFILGNQTTIEVLGTGKLNQHTTVDREQYEHLRDHYQVEYERSIQTVIEGIRISNSCCVQCRTDVKRVAWRP